MPHDYYEEQDAETRRHGKARTLQLIETRTFEDGQKTVSFFNLENKNNKENRAERERGNGC